mgnify:CR=1 FL=1
MCHPCAFMLAVFCFEAKVPKACIGGPGLDASGRVQGPGTVPFEVIFIVLAIFLTCIGCV